MNFYIRVSDYKELFKPTGPLFAFILPWAVVLIGQMMQLCDVIVPEYSAFYLVVMGNMLGFTIMAFCIQTVSPQHLSDQKKNLGDVDFSGRFQKIIYLLLTVYFLIEIFQVIYFKGFPLLWLILKIPKSYLDFGIGSLNGLLNAVYLLATTGLYLIYLKKRSYMVLTTLLFLFSVPVLLVSRQLLISLFLQIACCTLVYFPNKLKTIFKYGVILLTLFVVVGNYRTGLNILTEILGPKSYIPEFLYPLLWIYAYIVTPFNNVNANFDYIQPFGMPLAEMSSLIPSFLRGSLDVDASQTGFALVDSHLTVSTFYIDPMLDFGALYAFMFMTGFQLLFLLSYRRALRSKSMIHMIEYSILYMISILSIFSNLLLYLPVVFQLAIINALKIKLLKKSNQNVLCVDPNL